MRYNVIFKVLLLLMLPGFAFRSQAQSPTAPALSFNAFFLNDAKMTQSETEGPMAVGGDLIIAGDHNVALHNAGTFQVGGVTIGLLVNGKVQYQSGNSFKVLNDAYVKIGSQNGSKAWYKDENNAYSPIRITPGASYNGSPRIELSAKADTYSPEVSGISNPVFQGGLIDFAAAFVQLKANAAGLSACTDNATLTNANGDPIGRTGLPNQVKITLNPGINILNLSGSEMNNVQDFVFNNQPSASQVLIINVNASGTFNWNVWNSGSLGGLTNCKYILYNFYNTTTLTIQGNGAVEGTVLAPYAGVTKTSNSNIEGQVIAASYTQSGGGEIHYAVFEPSVTGCGTPPPPPTVASFSINDNGQCLTGNTFSFTNSSTGDAPLTYKWYFGDGNTSTNANPTHSYAAAGAYTVKLVATGGGGKDSVTKTVNVWSAPATGFTVNNSSQELTGNSFVFTTTSHVSGNTYKWYFGDGGTSTDKDPVHSYAAVGTYTVKQIITSNKGCKDSTTQVVTVTHHPTTASFSINDNGQCLTGNTFSFTNSSTGDAPLTYKWYFGDGNTSTDANPTHSYAAAGAYTVKLVATGAGGKDSVTKTVNVWGAPTTGFTVNNSSQELTGNSFVFTTTSHVSGNTYKWYFGDGGTSTDKDPVHSYAAVGTYTVKQVITSDKGCKDSTTQVVTVTHDPTIASFTVNLGTQCFNGHAFIFHNTSTGNAPLTYSWDFGDAATSADTDPVHSYAAPGVYTVTLIVTGAGGADTATLAVTVLASPAAGFTVNEETQELTGNSFVFTTTSHVSGNTYAWDFGDSTTSTDVNPVKSYDSAGPYQVVQIITAASGCKDTAVKTVVVLSDSCSSGNDGGVESESLGGLINKRDFNRIKYGIDTRVNYSKLPLFAQRAPGAVAKKTKGQELADMIPQRLENGDAVYVTSPTDLLSITAAVDVLSVDYTRNQKAKAVVLGIKTLDKAYSHTKSICDRFRGAELLFVDSVQIKGYNFTRFAMKRDGGVVEYALAFVIGKDSRRGSYTLQTNWLISEYAPDANVYNFQVWSANPDDAVKLASDILDNLKLEQPVEQINTVKLPAAYITYGMRNKENLVVRINNTTSATTGKIVFEERVNEDADVVVREYPVTLVPGKGNVYNIPIRDGYEYQGRVYINDVLEDEVYMADGNWGIDYDGSYTAIQQFSRGNNADREYKDNEYPVYRNVTLKAKTRDYVSVYKAVRSGTEKTDLTAYRSLKFFAKGTGRVEIRLTRDSIVDWAGQYKTEINLDENGKEYAISFDDFYSDRVDAAFNPRDVKTIVFTFSAGKDKSEEINFYVGNVSFSPEAVMGKRGLDSRDLTVAPNPSNGSFECYFVSDQERTLEFSVTDITGRVVYSRKVNAVIGVNNIPVHLNTSAGAVLMISLKGQDMFYDTRKMIIK